MESAKKIKMISVTVLTKNSQRYIREVLEALRPFDEVVVYDTGSTDETLSLARTFPNVSIYERPFIGFGPTHNQATAVAKHDWVLSVDSDEVVTPEMVEAILNTSLNEQSVYAFPRNNYFNGKLIKWCGWYPDCQFRLYNRKVTCFDEAQVHEGIIREGLRAKILNASLKHYSYASIAEFLDKMQLYSDLFAKQYVGKKRSSLLKAITHGFFSFFKSYLLKRGFLGGYEGFVISVYNGHTAYYKYLKLYEVNKKLER